MIKKETAFIII